MDITVIQNVSTFDLFIYKTSKTSLLKPLLKKHNIINLTISHNSRFNT